MTYHNDPNLTCEHKELVQVMTVTVIVPYGTQTINKRVLRDPATHIGNSEENHVRCAKCGLVILYTDNIPYVNAVKDAENTRRSNLTKINRIKITRELCDMCSLVVAKEIVEVMFADNGHGEPKESTAHVTVGQVKKEWNL